MANRINPSTVQIMSTEGEVKVTIALELTINLNADGVNVAASATQVIKEEKAKDDWMIPDFGASPKINFGKKE